MHCDIDAPQQTYMGLACSVLCSTTAVTPEMWKTVFDATLCSSVYYTVWTTGELRKNGIAVCHYVLLFYCALMCATVLQQWQADSTWNSKTVCVTQHKLSHCPCWSLFLWCHSVLPYSTVYYCVLQCSTVCHCVLLCVTVFYCVSLCVRNIWDWELNYHSRLQLWVRGGMSSFVSFCSRRIHHHHAVVLPLPS